MARRDGRGPACVGAPRRDAPDELRRDARGRGALTAEARVALPSTVPFAAFERRDPALAIRTLGGEALGTAWRIRFVPRGEADDGALMGLVESRLAAIVAQMSQWDPASTLSRFNRADAGEWFDLPRDLATVIEAALDLARRTDGAFDPTFGRTAALLGFGAEPADGTPSERALIEAAGAAGWRRLAFDRTTSRLRQPGGLWLDLSGIGKGHAVDAVSRALLDVGIEDALVEIGGEFVGRGIKPDGQPWWVDLESPPGLACPSLRIALCDGAVATSGDYVRGRHTLDPSTGRPATDRVASVSVLADSAMRADGWATALSVLGADSGMAIADEAGLAARIVFRDGGKLGERLSGALLAMLA